MKTKTELDPNFEYKDDSELTKDLKVLAVVVFSVICIVGTVILCIFGRNGFWDNI